MFSTLQFDLILPSLPSSTPQVKHMSGFFYSEGSFTKNSAAEVADMMHRLSQWANGDRPSYEQLMIEAMKKLPLQASTIPMDLQAFMGDW